MSRIRSKKLYRFLKDNGGFQNPRDIKRLKREYRRQYQNQWARQQRKISHEIRFTLTKEEYQQVQSHCQESSTTPTELAKELLLNHSLERLPIAKRGHLLSVARDLGLAINRIKAGGATDLQKLLSAETKLLEYLNI